MNIAQNLRDDATAIRNRKKIKELIKQKPDVNPKYYWNIVCHEAKAQSDTFFIPSLVKKVRYYTKVHQQYSSIRFFLANIYTFFLLP